MQYSKSYIQYLFSGICHNSLEYYMLEWYDRTTCVTLKFDKNNFVGTFLYNSLKVSWEISFIDLFCTCATHHALRIISKKIY